MDSKMKNGDKKLKKILFVDCFSPLGHVQFNRIQLEALCKIGEVYTAMRQGYYEKIGVEKAHNFIEIPDCYYRFETGKWKSLFNRALVRLTGYDIFKNGTLNFVRNRVQDDWDAVILSHFEPKPLSRMKPLHKVYAICHQYKLLVSSCVRLTRENNRIKYTKDVGNRYTIIALNDLMRQGIKSLGVKNVEVIPHGFLTMDGKGAISFLDKQSIPRNKRILFAPSFSHNVELMNQFYNNKKFDQFLGDNNFYLVIKDKNGFNNNKNVKIIKYWITEDEYKTLFLSSFCLVLPYGSKTPYRESGVIMECFANNKPFVKLDIPSLHVYDQYIIYDSTFSNIDTFILKLNKISSLNGIYFKNLDKIKDPYTAWQNLLVEK